MKNIGIIGCGWLGSHMAKHLFPKYKIYTSTTTQRKRAELEAVGYDSIAIQFSDNEIRQTYKSWKVLEHLDTIIISVPFSKRTDIKSLQNRFENISLFINDFDKQLFLMSSIGIYPQTQMEIGEETLDEQSLHPNILFVEQLIKNKFPQVNILRLGGLMGGDRIFSNYHTSNPDQFVNHVHYEDIVLITEKMIDKKIHSKIYNIVAPEHPTKQDVVNYQKGLTEFRNTQGQGRKITSTLSEQDIPYQYLHPDPKTFK
ncbi:NAD(P)-binding domain-containing protein [Sphingobacterium gobiense]|uniref:Epimerase n=1 Tax=Sphingobacterium gobiense TaxID=1382456 RepID=A0A2S9JUD3_9SPHI|nr:NAD(P)-binding domain-containing protein [Sphingobacterium gobiense]PRD56869.1 epimerase [Sphingobacterium gobiense]